jgi:hypothetical protein
MQLDKLQDSIQISVKLLKLDLYSAWIVFEYAVNGAALGKSEIVELHLGDAAVVPTVRFTVT